MPQATSSYTFFMSDIEASTRRWAADSDMPQALALHDELIRAAIANHSGRWIKHTGDGVLAVFADPVEAVKAAANTQRRFAAAGWPGDPLRVRIGLHSGSAIEIDGDVYGLAVSATARVTDAGHGGQIVVSQACALLVDQAPDDLVFLDLGRHRLKDLGEPWQLHQVAGPGIDETFPPLRTLDVADHNLPVQLTSFIGRQDELAQLVTLLDQHRLLTLTGVGGAGKTRLSLQLAADTMHRFLDGVRVAELASVSDPEAVPAAVEAALGLRYEAGAPTDVSKRIVEHLRNREMLVVIDNCEHVLGSAARLIESVLRGAPGVRVIASSREGLGIGGEWLWQVPSLDLTADEGESEAVLLFMERAKAVNPAIELDDENRPAVVRICQMLDGVPLAIELAAARAKVLSPGQIAERLEDRFRLLTGGSRSAMPRQQTLEATVAWSYQLLDHAERLLFERLSVFGGGFTLEAVEGVCVDEHIDPGDVLDLISGLVDKSMVTAGVSVGGLSRFGMLETLRHYAVRALMDHGETAHWKDRHAAWFAEWSAGFDHVTDLSGECLQAVAPEADNLLVALDWCDDDVAVSLVEALARHRYGIVGDLEGAIAVADRGLAVPGTPARTRAHLLCIKGRALTTIGQLDTGQAALRESLATIDTTFSDESAVCLLIRISNAVSMSLDPGEGQAIAERAVALAESLTPELHAAANHNAAWAGLWNGAEPETVLQWGETAAAHARAANDANLELQVSDVVVLATMSMDYRDGGDRTRAVEDHMLQLKNPESGFGWGFEWVGIRRADWVLTERELDAKGAAGRWRLDELVARGTMHWMRGHLTDAIAAFEGADRVGSPGRWHHDLYPGWAEATCLSGDLAGTRRLAEVHLGFTLRGGEESMRLATLRALVQAEIDAGHLDEASSVVERMRETLEIHPLRMGAPVQLSTPEGYLALAEAELTRLTGTDPEAWQRARRMNVWEYWRSYCDARRVEAVTAIGADATALHASASERSSELGFGWISTFLDRFAK